MEKRIMSKRIATIKQIKTEHQMPNDMILDLVYKNGGTVSESTLKRILADGSEEQNFQYAGVADIYNALVKEFGEDYKSDDIATLKSIILDRNRWIDRLAEEIETKKKEFHRREDLYSERKANYERTIEMLQARIDKQDEIIEKLLDAHLIKE
jgi:hypothetical protein